MKRLEELVLERYPGLRVCYLAILPGDERFNIEVEISDSECMTLEGKRRLDRTRLMANRLDQALTKNGVRVFQTRESWEHYLLDNDE